MALTPHNGRVQKFETTYRKFHLDLFREIYKKRDN